MTWLWRAEAGVVSMGLRVLRALGPIRAGALAAQIARLIGPLLLVSRVADENLRRTMPELNRIARRRVIVGVWDNLGRTVGELPHLATLNESASGPGWEYADPGGIRRLASAGGPLVLVTGHFANWEVLPRAISVLGFDLAIMYRPAGNSIVDAMVSDLRLTAAPSAQFFPKGSKGARQALGHLSRRGVVGILADQKMNDGIEARLLNLPAMTVSGPAALSLRYDCPIVMVRLERIGPARYRVVTETPLSVRSTGNRNDDILAMTQQMNDIFTTWIRARPTSWLWLHRRWPRL